MQPVTIVTRLTTITYDQIRVYLRLGTIRYVPQRSNTFTYHH